MSTALDSSTDIISITESSLAYYDFLYSLGLHPLTEYNENLGYLHLILKLNPIVILYILIQNKLITKSDIYDLTLHEMDTQFFNDNF